jgi:hypothetical protein
MGISSKVIARPFPRWSQDPTLSQELLDIDLIRENLCGDEAHAASSFFNLTSYNNFLLRRRHYRLTLLWQWDPKKLCFSSRIRFGSKNGEPLFVRSYGSGDSVERHDSSLILFWISKDLINLGDLKR